MVILASRVAVALAILALALASAGLAAQASPQAPAAYQVLFKGDVRDLQASGASLYLGGSICGRAYVAVVSLQGSTSTLSLYEWGVYHGTGEPGSWEEGSAANSLVVLGDRILAVGRMGPRPSITTLSPSTGSLVVTVINGTGRDRVFKGTIWDAALQDGLLVAVGGVDVLKEGIFGWFRAGGGGLVVLYDAATGEVREAYLLDAGAYTEARLVAVSNGHIYVYGTLAKRLGGEVVRGFIASLTPEGDVEWVDYINVTGASTQLYPTGLQPLPGGGILVTGYYVRALEIYGFIAVIDPQGRPRVAYTVGPKPSLATDIHEVYRPILVDGRVVVPILIGGRLHGFTALSLFLAEIGGDGSPRSAVELSGHPLDVEASSAANGYIVASLASLKRYLIIVPPPWRIQESLNITSSITMRGGPEVADYLKAYLHPTSTLIIMGGNATVKKYGPTNLTISRIAMKASVNQPCGMTLVPLKHPQQTSTTPTATTTTTAGGPATAKTTHTTTATTASSGATHTTKTTQATGGGPASAATQGHARTAAGQATSTTTHAGQSTGRARLTLAAGAAVAAIAVIAVLALRRG